MFASLHKLEFVCVFVAEPYTRRSVRSGSRGGMRDVALGRQNKLQIPLM